MMKDDDFKLLKGFADERTDKQTDICDCRVAFVTEKLTNWLGHSSSTLLNSCSFQRYRPLSPIKFLLCIPHDNNMSIPEKASHLLLHGPAWLLWCSQQFVVKQTININYNNTITGHQLTAILSYSHIYIFCRTTHQCSTKTHQYKRIKISNLTKTKQKFVACTFMNLLQNQNP